jgi:hypothetical protein
VRGKEEGGEEGGRRGGRMGWRRGGFDAQREGGREWETCSVPTQARAVEKASRMMSKITSTRETSDTMVPTYFIYIYIYIYIYSTFYRWYVQYTKMVLICAKGWTRKQG